MTQLPFGKSRGVFMRLAKAVGPVLSAIPMRPGDPFPIMEALAQVVERVSDAELERLTDDLCSDGACAYSHDGAKWPLMHKDNRETLFEGDLMLYFKWLAFATEVNFSAFFAGFAAPKGSAPSPEDSAG